MMCHSTSVPSTAPSAGPKRHQCAGRKRRARRPSEVSSRCSATSAITVNTAAAIITASFSGLGVEEKRESMSACTRAPPSCPASRSVNTPTIWGLMSRVTLLRNGVPSARDTPTNSAVVAASVASTLISAHEAISATGAESSGTSRCRSVRVPSATETTRPLLVAWPDATGMVDSRVDAPEPSTEQGSEASRRSGTYDTRGAVTLAASGCGQSSVARSCRTGSSGDSSASTNPRSPETRAIRR
ncbi:hypothetical protein CJ468_05324 [Nocardia farcinica]|nr:hypothetical protein CJ468_05324 [Nocardia farcinica]